MGRIQARARHTQNDSHVILRKKQIYLDLRFPILSRKSDIYNHTVTARRTSKRLFRIKKKKESLCFVSRPESDFLHLSAGLKAKLPLRVTFALDLLEVNVSLWYNACYQEKKKNLQNK